MRVTDQMIYRRATHDVTRHRSAMFRLQQQSATGYKFQTIEEDPVSAQRVRMLREAKEATMHYRKNIERSRTQLDTADTALGEATNILIRAKEIALAMGNQIASQDERDINASEVGSLLDSMVNVANTEAGGEFVFSGYATNTRPFQADGTYVGDGNLKRVDVGPSMEVEVGISGERAFTAGGGIDVFNELAALQTALSAGDNVGIQTAIGNIDTCIQQVSRARTDAGLKANRLDVAENVRQSLQDSLTKEESSVIDIDPVETFMDLNQTSKALQESMTVARKVTDLSLLNRL